VCVWVYGPSVQCPSVLICSTILHYIYLVQSDNNYCRWVACRIWLTGQSSGNNMHQVSLDLPLNFLPFLPFLDFWSTSTSSSSYATGLTCSSLHSETTTDCYTLLQGLRTCCSSSSDSSDSDSDTCFLDCTQHTRSACATYVQAKVASGERQRTFLPFFFVDSSSESPSYSTFSLRLQCVFQESRLRHTSLLTGATGHRVNLPKQGVENREQEDDSDDVKVGRSAVILHCRRRGRRRRNRPRRWSRWSRWGSWRGRTGFAAGGSSVAGCSSRLGLIRGNCQSASNYSCGFSRWHAPGCL
jgi:hypothetical protein